MADTLTRFEIVEDTDLVGIGKVHIDMISLVMLRSPVASLIATMLGCFARRATVAADIVIPVRPGMLYSTIGRSTDSASVMKCR